MVSGQARLRGWSSSSSSSSRIFGKMSAITWAECVHVENIHARLRRKRPYLVYIRHAVHGRSDFHRDLCAVGDVLISFRTDRKKRIDFKGCFFFLSLKWITGQIREVLELSTFILSWRLCLRDGSYVEKQNMLVIRQTDRQTNDKWWVNYE